MARISHAGIFNILQIKSAIVVVGNFARIKVVAAKVVGGNDGVGAGAAAGFVSDLVLGSVVDQLRLAWLIHQCHDTLGYRHGGQVTVADGYFGIDQRRAYAVDMIMSHACLVLYGWMAAHYAKRPGQMQNR